MTEATLWTPGEDGRVLCGLCAHRCSIAPGRWGISRIVVERGTPGFTVSRKLKKMGWWASDTAELHFEGCRVPVENLIGEENAGFLAIMQNFAVERVHLAAQCVAIATLAYRESVAYARERQAFGKSRPGEVHAGIENAACLLQPLRHLQGRKAEIPLALEPVELHSVEK